jgi:hypothetical protein
MVSISRDIRMAVDRVAFAEELGLAPDRWQEDLLRSTSSRILLNCCRQSGKSTMSALIALHRALYYPGSLVLCLAPALRQSQELFAKVASFYRSLGEMVQPQGERRLSGGSLIALTTPYGRRGVFFEEWTEGATWERYEVPAGQCPRIGEAFLDEERRSLPARVYRQEYECSFEETDDQVFSYADVEAAISEDIQPLFSLEEEAKPA